MIEAIIPSAGSTSVTTPASAQQPLGKDDFLQLLVARLSSQGPLNPMDSREFSAQLAQFSSLEQMTNINNTLEELVTAQLAMDNSSMISLIGKLVYVPGDSFQHTQGETTALTYSLSREASSTTIKFITPPETW